MRYLLWGVALLVLVGLAGFGGWLLTLPSSTPSVAAPQVLQAETKAMLASLHPPKDRRPVIALIGLNEATETTDYLMPTGILRRADIADVTMVSAGPGPVQLYPALRVEADQTLAEFDALHPEGADYVIVPAMSRDDDPLILDWLRSQAAKGARVIGVCAGAKVLAAAGLLNGRRATTHWYYLDEMLERSPTINYVADRRMVSDDAVTTTTGVSASMPMMLTLIEAIAGRAKAEKVAAELGVTRWDVRHASQSFQLTRPFALTVLANRLSFWNMEEMGLRIDNGIDEVSLALAADAWSRSYRSSVRSVAPSLDPIVSANGIRILPDVDETFDGSPVPLVRDLPPADTLEQTLNAIADRYGPPTASVVAVQLEYQWPESGS